MNIRKSSLAILLAVAAAPQLVQASEPSANAAFDRCVEQFTAEMATNRRVRDTRVDYSYNSPTAELWRVGKYTVELSARGADSGAVVARARCEVNGDGIVLIKEGAEASKAIVEVR